ncbi:MAG: hypothetical protein ACI9DF_001673 [Verrucomicrobiales bacterium]
MLFSRRSLEIERIMVSDPNESSEQMRYQILGEDNASIEEKLAKYAGRASWDDLKEHLISGALIYVDSALDLPEVGRAFAEDDQKLVSAWLASGDLVKPSAPHGAYWESINAKFQCQVVSPFVLIQSVDEDDVD